MPFFWDFAACWRFFGVMFRVLCFAGGLPKYQDRQPAQDAQSQGEHSGI